MYSENVARGIAVLDERRPDWRRFVEVDELDSCDPKNCVVGQVFDVGTRWQLTPIRERFANPFIPMSLWINALIDLGAPTYSRRARDWHDSPTKAWAVEHGFDVHYDANDLSDDHHDETNLWYAALTDAWREALRPVPVAV